MQDSTGLYPIELEDGTVARCRFANGKASVHLLDTWVDIDGSFLPGDTDAVVAQMNIHMAQIDAELDRALAMFAH